MKLLPFLSIAVYLFVAFMFCWTEGKKSVIGFWGSLVACIILTPLGGVLLVWLLPKKNRPGCLHCGNKYNEAEYCGICGKNILGERKEGLYYSEMEE
jgi:hypothetical protein